MNIPAVEIRPPGWKDLLALPTLFKRATEEDFNFYSITVRKRIRRKNSLVRLIVATVRSRRLILVARKENNCIGLLLGSWNAHGVAVINWLYVVADCRKQGVGAQLVVEAETHFNKAGCHKITLTTETVPNFYKNIGFKLEGTLEKHWWKKTFYIFSKLLI